MCVSVYECQIQKHFLFVRAVLTQQKKNTVGKHWLQTEKILIRIEENKKPLMKSVNMKRAKMNEQTKTRTENCY